MPLTPLSLGKKGTHTGFSRLFLWVLTVLLLLIEILKFTYIRQRRRELTIAKEESFYGFFFYIFSNVLEIRWILLHPLFDACRLLLSYLTPLTLRVIFLSLNSTSSSSRSRSSIENNTQQRFFSSRCFSADFHHFARFILRPQWTWFENERGSDSNQQQRYIFDGYFQISPSYHFSTARVCCIFFCDELKLKWIFKMSFAFIEIDLLCKVLVIQLAATLETFIDSLFFLVLQ